jgi:hypothetical protein
MVLREAEKSLLQPALSIEKEVAISVSDSCDSGVFEFSSRDPFHGAGPQESQRLGNFLEQKRRAWDADDIPRPSFESDRESDQLAAATARAAITLTR